MMRDDRTARTRARAFTEPNASYATRLDRVPVVVRERARAPRVAISSIASRGRRAVVPDLTHNFSYNTKTSSTNFIKGIDPA